MLLALVGACGGRLSDNDAGTAGGSGHDNASLTAGTGGSSSGGRSAIETPVGVQRGGVGGDLGGSEPPACSSEGGAPAIYGNCSDYQDVVCSWQRVTLPQEQGGAPCDEAESLIDPAGAPEGGAGGAWPGRNACADYAVDPNPQLGECVDKCCEFVEATIEERIGTCTIAGHCCVLLNVHSCGI